MYSYISMRIIQKGLEIIRNNYLGEFTSDLKEIERFSFGLK